MGNGCVAAGKGRGGKVLLVWSVPGLQQSSCISELGSGREFQVVDSGNKIEA